MSCNMNRIIGEIIKGFNRYGDLVVIYDNYENAVAVEYEDYDLSVAEAYRISRLYDNTEKQIVFKYNYDNNLVSITDARGRKTKYEYDGSNRLSKVTYPDGASLVLSYDGADLISVKNTGELLMSVITYLRV